MLTAFFMSLSQAITAAPLKPVDEWKIDQAPATCILSRSYGEGAGRMTLEIWQRPLSTTARIVLRTVSDGKPFQIDDAVIELGPGIEKFDTYYVSDKTPKATPRKTVLNFPAEKLDELKIAATITVKRKKMTSNSFELPDIAAAMEKMAECRQAVAEQWGLSADAPMPANRKPLQPYIKASDFPSNILSPGQEVSPVVLLNINADGRGAGCRVVQSSGVAAIDNLLCPAVTRNARFEKPVDATGKPLPYAMTIEIKYVQTTG